MAYKPGPLAPVQGTEEGRPTSIRLARCRSILDPSKVDIEEGRLALIRPSVGLDPSGLDPDGPASIPLCSV